jgi:hypothetical protein
MTETDRKWSSARSAGCYFLLLSAIGTGEAGHNGMGRDCLGQRGERSGGTRSFGVVRVGHRPRSRGRDKPRR